jgi:hypothetical protein
MSPRVASALAAASLVDPQKRENPHQHQQAGAFPVLFHLRAVHPLRLLGIFCNAMRNENDGTLPLPPYYRYVLVG